MMSATDKLEGWRTWTLILLTLFMSVAPRVFYLNFPLFADEGAYAYMSDTIQHGGLPYIDAFDHKPPLIYYFYYLAFNLFGRSVSSPRILAIFIAGAACFLLLILVYRLTKNLSAAIFSSLVLGLASFSSVYAGYSVNTELFTLPFIIGGILFLFEEEPPLRSVFTAGLLFGIGFMIKQPVAIIAVFVFIAPGVRLLKRSASLFFKAVCMFGLGAALPLAVLMLFYYSKGGLVTFWESCFSYNFGYIDAVTFSQSLSGLYASLKGNLLYDPVTWFAGIAGLVLIFKSSTRVSYKTYVLMLLIGSIAATAVGKSFKCYYFVLLLPVLALAAGLGLAIMLKIKHSGYVRAATVLLVCIAYYAIFRFIPPPAGDFKKWSDLGPYYTTTLNARSIGNYLRYNAFPGASVFIIGSEPSILFYSGLKSASRIYYFWPLVIATKMREKLQLEVLSELAINPPDFVVLINESHSIGMGTVAGDAFIRELFQRFAHYQLRGVIADNSESLFVGDFQEMRRISGKGASMLLLGRPTPDNYNEFTFGDLFGKKVDNGV